MPPLGEEGPSNAEHRIVDDSNPGKKAKISFDIVLPTVDPQPTEQQMPPWEKELKAYLDM